MAKNVNLWVSDITPTGANPPVPRWELEITAEWVDNSGTPHTRTETERFPDILADMTNAWNKERLTDLILDAIRVKYGIDEE